MTQSIPAVTRFGEAFCLVHAPGNSRQKEECPIRNNLARWRGEVGDPAGAATAYEQLLTDQLRVLGPDHPQHHQHS